MKYRLRDITPEDMCIVINCPRIYKEENSEDYLIVGRVVNPEEVGLAEKVMEGEALVRVPKRLIDERK